MDNCTKLYRIKKTCMEMLHDRGYLVSQDELEMDKQTFREQYTEDPKREDLTTLVPKQDDPTEQIFVFFPDEVKVGVKSIKVFAERMRNESVNRAIMVVVGSLTPFSKQCLQEMQPAYYIEVFSDAELLINITKHVLVPEHRLLTTEEKKGLLDRYKVKDTQLPRIQFNDPVARYYGMQRGQVVRIVRPSETAGRYVTYRLCV
ncbi:hypothetical protein WJX81_001238 [Elliptochloris bilobata]|uniref:Uncharacterized protein n=1 Tax=Elliptochloris bilobata TaxID=381761 RepID=A0AAW1RFH0_9CHLO